MFSMINTRLLQNQAGRRRGILFFSLANSLLFVKIIFGLFLMEYSYAGKEQLQSYFKIALDKYPQLHFTHIKTLFGVNSVVIHYESVNGLLAAETMLVDPERPNIVTHVFCHYAKKE